MDIVFLKSHSINGKAYKKNDKLKVGVQLGTRLIEQEFAKLATIKKIKE